MKTINLRWMYPHYRHDEFVEVSDEVWEAMRQAQREMNNYERRKVYHRAWYSLDAYSWTENYALEHGRSPEDARIRYIQHLQVDFQDFCCHLPAHQLFYDCDGGL